MPRQTVHRVLTQLEATQLIIRDVQRDRFMVGPKLAQLGLSALNSENYGAPIREILQELVNEVQETCNIGILRGLDVLYLERIECDWPLRLNLAKGSHLPAHCAATGKVLLAHMPARTRAALLRSVPLEQ
ncbi:MAG: IclR family transcriptional regulator, partial [Alphaproteobacteria bacterium]